MPKSTDNDITPLDPATPMEMVTIVHPALPGIESSQPRTSLPTWESVGWSESKSKAAPAAVETKTPRGANPSKEAES